MNYKKCKKYIKFFALINMALGRLKEIKPIIMYGHTQKVDWQKSPYIKQVNKST